MSKLFDDTMQGLLEAVAIKNGDLPIERKMGMPGATYQVTSHGRELVDQLVAIRKNTNVSQSELAHRTGSTQQVISRFETHSSNVSINLFASIVDALGYEIHFVRKNA